jgi:superoxide dismutase, Cu-Zn family
MLTAWVTFLPDFNSTLKSINGTAVFNQASSDAPIEIILSLSGLTPNSIHGWHIHSNPLVDGSIVNCSTTGGHFNPLNTTHGAPENEKSKRHYGDLGNFVTDANGNVKLTKTDPLISLHGTYPVSGLGMVIHEKMDDLGLGSAPASGTTGNVGSRLACGNIAVSQVVDLSKLSGTATSTTSPESITITSHIPVQSNGGLVDIIAVLASVAVPYSLPIRDDGKRSQNVLRGNTTETRMNSTGITVTATATATATSTTSPESSTITSHTPLETNSGLVNIFSALAAAMNSSQNVLGGNATESGMNSTVTATVTATATATSTTSPSTPVKDDCDRSLALNGTSSCGPVNATNNNLFSSSGTTLVGLYDQCGGKDFSGPSACITGSTCEYKSEWYSQCKPVSAQRR